MARDPRWYARAAGYEDLSDAADGDPMSRWIMGILLIFWIG